VQDLLHNQPLVQSAGNDLDNALERHKAHIERVETDSGVDGGCNPSLAPAESTTDVSKVDITGFSSLPFSAGEERFLSSS